VQENDFRREKAISKEYETRELSRAVSVFAHKTHLCFRELFHCATIDKENMYYDFLYVVREASGMHSADFN